MTRDKRLEAGLEAVARVRDVRERDSRLGLTQALGELHQRQAVTAALLTQISALSGPAESAPGDFLQARTLAGLGSQLAAEAQADVVAAALLADTSRSHWSTDATRLAAVHLLLERRARARAEAEQREEARRLDEAATQGWLRARNGGAA